ncbi:hypothetical protein [Streptomyces tubercidicus]
MELADEDSSVLLIHLQGQERRVKESAGAGAVRPVPASPEWAATLKAEITRRDLRPDDATFVLDDGQPLTASAYRKVWPQARAAVLEVPMKSQVLPGAGARGSAATDAIFA